MKTNDFFARSDEALRTDIHLIQQCLDLFERCLSEQTALSKTAVSMLTDIVAMLTQLMQKEIMER